MLGLLFLSKEKMHKTTAGFFVVVKIIMCKSELAVQAHACQHQSSSGKNHSVLDMS